MAFTASQAVKRTCEKKGNLEVVQSKPFVLHLGKLRSLKLRDLPKATQHVSGRVISTIFHDVKMLGATGVWGSIPGGLVLTAKFSQVHVEPLQ